MYVSKLFQSGYGYGGLSSVQGSVELSFVLYSCGPRKCFQHILRLVDVQGFIDRLLKQWNLDRSTNYFII